MNSTAPAGRDRIHRSVWVLGFVSMFMDISSEMIHALLPLYLVVVLGASVTAVGVIEGIAEATASIVKVFSGALSDWVRRRKMLAAIGYGIAALTKPVFPLATGIGWLVAARFVDRVGKGIRGAPRDALIADVTPESLRGASYGLRQSLDTIGAFVGPLLAMLLMWLTMDSFRTVFWWAVVPAFLAVALILVGVQEPPAAPGLRKVKAPLSRTELKHLGRRYWWIVAIGTVFTLARFSEAFLLLRAKDIGLPVTWTPAVLVLMNVVYAATAYPVGSLSDRIERMPLLMVGLILLIGSDLALAWLPGFLGLGVGIVLWGLHMGFTQGVFAALVADAAPAELRGTAFGMFHLLTGVAMLAASVIAGVLWDTLGAATTFVAGAAFAAVALAGLGWLRLRRHASGNAR